MSMKEQTREPLTMYLIILGVLILLSPLIWHDFSYQERAEREILDISQISDAHSRLVPVYFRCWGDQVECFLKVRQAADVYEIDEESTRAVTKDIIAWLDARRRNQ